MKNDLYNFTDGFGSFTSSGAGKIKNLYLPLCNEIIMSSISPELRGDIKTGQSHFLMPPVSRADLSSSKNSRNFWVYIDKDKIWSAAGVSKDSSRIKEDIFELEAGLLWQRLSRKNKKIGLRAEILSFVPAGPDAVELMQVRLSNISGRKIRFTPYAAIPLYCRSADNVRDHRQVTSLLNRITLQKPGIVLKPAMIFDEAGHRQNKTNYFVAGLDGKGRPPQYFYPTQEMFCGEGGDLEAPVSVLENRLPGKENIQGKEGMGALRFYPVELESGKSVTYIILLGIQEGKVNLRTLLNKFNSPQKIEELFIKTKKHWSEISNQINIDAKDAHFANWLRWVNTQPVLRKIFGCSFLPDFDYGKGGRGWRDLWQDCLNLILNDPRSVRPALINNFCGVKIDGSNATIIGKKSGEFIADRNNLSRVWMDHGAWPLLTLDLYINETGDAGILFEKATYFRNHEINRAGKIDQDWAPDCGNKLKTKSGKIYAGTILEHLLAQNLVQFFNAGPHNHIRLEGADWNDGLDMAKDNGESVAFSAMYANNLELLSKLLFKAENKKIEVAEELKILLSKVSFQSSGAKHKILNKYFAQACCGVSGKKVLLDARKLAENLKIKAEWIKNHIRKAEWLKEGFFNGYYDNRKARVEGKKGKFVRMTLTGQVFPVMAGVSTKTQIKKILANVKRCLYDKKLGSIHLNTDFKTEMPDLGRAFSFVYGEKENGAIFSHMVVMFAYALYKQGFAEDGWQVLNSLYKMAANTKRSRIYPCLPEYFNLDGRGMYAYLTGSASWFMLTLLTESFGVKGIEGDLLIEPKLVKEQFSKAVKICVERKFAGRRLRVNFLNPKRLTYGSYRIVKLFINSEKIPIAVSSRAVVTREVILGLPRGKLNVIDIYLG